MQPIPRHPLPSGFAPRRIVTGLWQMADQERDGRTPDRGAMAADLAACARDGFDCWDMADHYGSSEIVAGRAARLLAAEGGPAPAIMTKWCPPPGPMTADVVRRGVETAPERVGAPGVDVTQFHWWRYEHLEWLPALEELARLREAGLFRFLGLTNFDAAHLRLLCRHGSPVATNQVCFSLVDRRAAGRMAEVAAEEGVGILAFGTLLGGFLSERWLGAPEPAAIGGWSKMKYKRFIDAAGGSAPFQGLLRALDGVARKHGVSIPNVATRWVLDTPGVAAVIVGARLGEADHRADNARMLALALDDDDRAAIATATGALAPIPGDCGDEYRRPPFLTASGDLSHHLDAVPKYCPALAVPARPDRTRVSSGSAREAKAGFSRAVRVGDRVLVSGTTATDGRGNVVCPGDVEGQTVYILDKIAAAVEAAGARHGRRGAHLRLPDRPSAVGGCRARPRPGARRGDARKHAYRRRSPCRPLPGRDRGRGRHHRRRTMKIEAIRVWQLDLPLREGRYAWSEGKFVDVFDATVVEIVADGGLTGVGEVCPLGPFYLPAYGSGARAGIAELGPHLIGLDPRETAVVEAVMDRALLGHPYVKSALDMACWDLAGKAAGLPVATLMGGRFGPSVALYRAISQAAPEAMAENVAGYRAQGYRKFQLKVGGRAADDIARIRAVAAVLQPGDVLVADANTGWTSADALRVCAAVKDVDVYIEQPCRSYEECLGIRRATALPFILDENIDGLPAFLRAHQDGAMNAINLKISKVGGLSKARRIRDLCVALGYPMTIEDSWGGDVVTAAIAHLAHSTPERCRFSATDFNAYGTVAFAPGAPQRVAGTMAASDAPGLGVTLDRAVLGRPAFEIAAPRA